MGNNIRNISFYFFIFSLFFLGGIGVGIVSIRNICAAVLFIYSLYNLNRIKLDRCQKLYLIYLGFLLLSNIFNGQLIDYDFIQNLIAYHFVSIVLFMAIPLFFSSLVDVKKTILFLILIYVFNACISILQFFNIPLGWSIGFMISPGASSLFDGQFAYLKDSENFMSRSIVFGITGFVVANGYFLASFLPIATHKILFKNESVKDNILSILIFLLACITIFMVQQRMAFGLLLFYILFVIYLRTNLLSRIFILLLIIFTICLYHIPTDLDAGRLTEGITTDDRMNQLSHFIDFFNSDSFIWGADLQDMHLLYTMGHNTLMDALRRGGFITFLIYVILFIDLFFKCIKTSFNAYKSNFKYTFIFSICCLIFLLYSFTHATGIQSGAVYFWLLYSLMLVSNNYENEKNIMFNR